MYHHLHRLKKVYRDRGLAKTARTVFAYAPIEINNFVFQARFGAGSEVMAEDWDNLVILDGCRYDMFERRNGLEGELQSRISLGSTSEEFFQRNFEGRTFFDTVYVNANPYVPHLDLDESTFHSVIDLLDEWDTEIQTVHPETVAEAARTTHDEFPGKRLIVHFMQPHQPFIGKKGGTIEGRGWLMGQEQSAAGEKTIWQLLRDGEFDHRKIDQVWEAYDENLDIVVKYVNDLLEEFSGRTVITADHGNMVGERQWPIPTKRLYGHYYGVYTPELVKVPWFVIKDDTRKELRSEPPVEANRTDEDTTQQRLEALGYVE